MKLIGIMPVRNEAYCLGLTARAALMWCDELLVGLHACTDESETICDQIQSESDRLFFMDLDGEAWDEMLHRQLLLKTARLRGATHIAIIDADEILTGNLLHCMNVPREAFGVPQGSILQLPGYNLRGSLSQYHTNGIWGNRWFSVAFADDPRLVWSGDKFHSREPQDNSGRRPRLRLNNYRPIAQGDGGVMHLWGASERRLIAKHALYKLTERLRWPERRISDIDAMYNLAIKGDPANFGFLGPDKWTYKETKPDWWLPYSHLIEHLDVNAEPWQEMECIRLVKEHGPRIFQGLDLFGVV